MVNVELVSDQQIFELVLPEGSIVLDAIQAANIVLQNKKVGIFSKIVPLDQPLKSGDRVEIYHPLLIDPKIKRKQKVKR